MKKAQQTGDLRFPKWFFEPEDESLPWYGEVLGLKECTDWFISLIGQESWERRRDAIASRFYDALEQKPVDESEKGRFFDDKDQFGWYLFLAEAFQKHPLNYEVFFGARVIPVFAAIGRNIELLQTVDGFEGATEALISNAKSQPNGGLFEILVAAAYAREGWTVRFKPKQRGGPRTHDLDVEKEEVKFAVECKRIEGGDYVESERARARTLWQIPSLGLANVDKRSTFGAVNFKVELSDVPEDYLLKKVWTWVKAGQPIFKWDDEISEGHLEFLNLKPLQSALAKGPMLVNSPVLNSLLTGRYIRDENLISLLSIKRGDTPRTLEDIDLAVVLSWESSSEAAIDKKARDIQGKLVEANDQLPGDTPGIIHIGFEALSGDSVEHRRYNKILDRISNFDPGKSNLQTVYCHYFAPETKPEEVWAFDETVQWIGKRPGGGPLTRNLVVLPDDEFTRPGVHWES